MLKDEFLMLMQFLDYLNGFLEEKAENIVFELVDNWYPIFHYFLTELWKTAKPI